MNSPVFFRLFWEILMLWSTDTSYEIMDDMVLGIDVGLKSIWYILRPVCVQDSVTRIWACPVSILQFTIMQYQLSLKHPAPFVYLRIIVIRCTKLVEHKLGEMMYYIYIYIFDSAHFCGRVDGILLWYQKVGTGRTVRTRASWTWQICFRVACSWIFWQGSPCQ